MQALNAIQPPHATCRLDGLEEAEASGAWAPFSRIYAVLQPLGWDLLRTHLGPEDRATLALVEAYEILQTGAAWTGLQAQLQAEGGTSSMLTTCLCISPVQRKTIMRCCIFSKPEVNLSPESW